SPLPRQRAGAPDELPAAPAQAASPRWWPTPRAAAPRSAPLIGRSGLSSPSGVALPSVVAQTCRSEITLVHFSSATGTRPVAPRVRLELPTELVAWPARSRPARISRVTAAAPVRRASSSTISMSRSEVRLYFAGRRRRAPAG